VIQSLSTQNSLLTDIGRTASGMRWRMRLEDDRTAYAISQTHGIPEIIARIIASRGVTLDEAPHYLAPRLRTSLPDPSRLRDMEIAAKRVADALAGRETIAIFGDYDVDGATSAALLMRYLRTLGVTPIPYIPDRMREGYGLNAVACDALIDQGVTLMITVDCGTLSYSEIDHARTRGCEVIVLDHHTAQAQLPSAIAVVNPNRMDDNSGQGTLAAVGVTFLFLIALNRLLRMRGTFSDTLSEPDLMALLDVVALGTVADVVPLTGLNRVLVAQGLKVLTSRRSVGLAALMDVAQLSEPPSTYHLGFLLGPRINAGGRVGESGLGLELLICDDPIHAGALASRLDQYNRERQAIEARVLEAAMAQSETQANLPVMLLAGEGWHAGVIGIVAGRIKEHWQRPVAIVTLENVIGKASARSVTGVDMGAAVHRAHAQQLIEAGGGHAMAAGFTVRAEKIEALHQFFIHEMQAHAAEYTASRSLKLDGVLTCAGATPELLEQIESAGPYGAGNPAPRFVWRNVQIVNRQMMKDKHLRVIVTDAVGKAKLTAVAFNVNGTPLGEMLTQHHTLHLAGTLKSNNWQGRESLQLMIDDAAMINA
jgi:single-stranded-DNA-specific exonuclease